MTNLVIVGIHREPHPAMIILMSEVHVCVCFATGHRFIAYSAKEAWEFLDIYADLGAYVYTPLN